jgi:hypothetical protein
VDKQCGVAERALRTLLDVGLPTLMTAALPAKQDFLDAAHHLTKYVFRSEVAIGDFLSDDILDWYGEAAPLLFSNLNSPRQHLDGLCQLLRCIPECRSTQSVLLVEGPSELRFLTRMVTSSLAWFMFKQFDTYSGSGNRRKRRIEMLIKHYRSHGYDVHLQIDADGRDASQKKQTAANELGLPTDRVFAFSWDFESAVPLTLAAQVLAHVLGQRDASVQQIAAGLGPKGTLKDLLGLVAPETPLQDIKVEFAQTLGDQLATNYRWYHDREFMATELGQFLDFVRRV